ncbi:hypothetical protein Tco_1395642, partial [Tanacetum coccineum]
MDTPPDKSDVSDEEIKVNKKGKAKVGDEDLSKPFKEVLKCPFTRRIVEFSSPRHRMPTNAKIYDRTGDPEDHVGRFARIGNQGEWPMPIWDAQDKDPTEILKIVRRANETLPNFKERWCPELSKRFSDNIPKIVDEMLKRVDDYLWSEEPFLNTELPKGEFQQKDTPVQWGQRSDQNQRFPYENHRR